MLRHIGRKRTYQHDLKLAAVLCLTAGFVNIAGLLGFFVLTTNVTGHAAYFAAHLSRQEYRQALVVALWMLLFLAGAFTSGFFMRSSGYFDRYAYTVPIAIEIVILALVGTFGHYYDRSTGATEYFAGSLLFAMGIQNAMVTLISGSVVRTTHLTGMFTDLGIDLSSLLHRHGLQNTLNRRITLRIVIIACFLLGGIIGGYLFQFLKYHTFFIPAALLCIVLCYDPLKVIVINLRQRMQA